MTSKAASHSQGTLAAIAALAFIVACVAHEAVGHGGMCMALGGKITLLTSVYFRCSHGGAPLDAAGPLTNLAVGAIFWGLLRGRHAMSSHGHLFCVMAMGFNLFWGAGYLIYSAVTNVGDCAFVLRDLALEPNWIWRLFMGVLGVFLYERAVRLVELYLPSGTPLITPYFVAGVVSCLAALFFTGATFPALREAAQESFGAAIGLLLLAYRNRNQGPVFISRSNVWILAAALATLVFVATLGRGLTLDHPA